MTKWICIPNVCSFNLDKIYYYSISNQDDYCGKFTLNFYDEDDEITHYINFKNMKDLERAYYDVGEFLNSEICYFRFIKGTNK